MTEKVLKFYKSLLESTGMIVDSNYRVKTNISGTKSIPVTIDDMPLVLPSKSHLKNLFNTSGSRIEQSMAIFNPANESIIRGETKSLRKLRMAFGIKLSIGIAALMEYMIRVLCNTKHQNIGDTDILEFIKDISAINNRGSKQLVDDKLLENIQSYIQSVINTEHGFVKLYITNGGRINKDKYSRTCSVTFKAYEDLIESGTNVYSKKLRIKDHNVIKALYEFIFPDIDTPHNYIFGSNSKVAPALSSLLEAVYTLAERINYLLDSFGKISDNEYEEYKIDLDWYDFASNIDDHEKEIRLIPNINDIRSNKEKEEPKFNAPNVDNNEVNKTVNKSNSEPALDHKVSSSPNGIDPKELLQKMNGMQGSGYGFQQPGMRNYNAPIPNQYQSQQFNPNSFNTANANKFTNPQITNQQQTLAYGYQQPMQQNYPNPMMNQFNNRY